MFGPSHYVPILRWKHAERFALRYLDPYDREKITPLIEFTPSNFKSKKTTLRPATARDPENVVLEEAKNLLEACGNAPFFLDLGHVAAEVRRIRGKIHALECFAELGRSYKLALMPVTGMERPDDYQASVRTIVQADKRGTCLRVTPSEIASINFARNIKKLLATLNLAAADVHLLVDYQANDPTVPDPREVLAAIPNLERWRTLSVAGGAFPADLQGFGPGNHRIPRSDWLAWKKAVVESGTRRRKPTFSDYTIQYGLYKEPIEGCNPSVSVRYTLEEEWLIMRGEAIRTKATSDPEERRPGREQWWGHAQLLCDNPRLFYGKSYSWADGFIHPSLFSDSLRRRQYFYGYICVAKMSFDRFSRWCVAPALTTH